MELTLENWNELYAELCSRTIYRGGFFNPNKNQLSEVAIGGFINNLLTLQRLATIAEMGKDLAGLQESYQTESYPELLLRLAELKIKYSPSQESKEEKR